MKLLIVAACLSVFFHSYSHHSFARSLTSYIVASASKPRQLPSPLLKSNGTHYSRTWRLQCYVKEIEDRRDDIRMRVRTDGILLDRPYQQQHTPTLNKIMKHQCLHTAATVTTSISDDPCTSMPRKPRVIYYRKSKNDFFFAATSRACRIHS